MQINPVNDHILIKCEDVKEETDSGIILTAAVEEEVPQIGEVLAVSPINTSKFEIKKGDKLLFSKYAPSEVKIDKEEFTFIQFDDVIAIIK